MKKHRKRGKSRQQLEREIHQSAANDWLLNWKTSMKEYTAKSRERRTRQKLMFWHFFCQPLLLLSNFWTPLIAMQSPSLISQNVGKLFILYDPPIQTANDSLAQRMTFLLYCILAILFCYTVVYTVLLYTVECIDFSNLQRSIDVCFCNSLVFGKRACCKMKLFGAECTWTIVLRFQG